MIFASMCCFLLAILLIYLYVKKILKSKILLILLIVVSICIGILFLSLYNESQQSLQRVYVDPSKQKMDDFAKRYEYSTNSQQKTQQDINDAIRDSIKDGSIYDSIEDAFAD